LFQLQVVPCGGNRDWECAIQVNAY
jgi:hypothetical protein